MNDIKAPPKKWRVRPRGGESVLYSSERKAYDAIPAITSAGSIAIVEHWENGRWVLYETALP